MSSLAMLPLNVAGGIATLALDRPPVNAMNDEWVAAFHARLDELGTREDWSVLHIRSAHAAFSAGADLEQMRERFTDAGLEPQLASIREYQQLFTRIEALPAVTLAEIGGAALGGGFELTMACDLPFPLVGLLD